MEKALKKVSEVEIELNDGKKVTLATLTEKDFPNVKLDKENGIPLKRGIVKDDGTNYVERRFFKRTNNAKIVLFDLTIPLTEAEFNKLAFSVRLDNFVKGYRVAEDAERITGEGLASDDKAFIALTKKMAKGQPLTVQEKAMAQTYYKMKLAGFFK